MSRAPASTDVFQAIADPTRRQILQALGREAQPVSALAGQFAVTLSAVSQHMRVLREAGLVTVRPCGRERIYQINPAPLQTVSEWVEQYEEFWRGRMEALGANLEEE